MERTRLFLREVPTMWIEDGIAYNRSPGHRDRVRRLATFRMGVARARRCLREYDFACAAEDPNYRVDYTVTAFACPRREPACEPAMFFHSIPDFDIEPDGEMVNCVYAEGNGEFSFYMRMGTFRDLVATCERMLCEYDSRTADILPFGAKGRH